MKSIVFLEYNIQCNNVISYESFIVSWSDAKRTASFMISISLLIRELKMQWFQLQGYEKMGVFLLVLLANWTALCKQNGTNIKSINGSKLGLAK